MKNAHRLLALLTLSLAASAAAVGTASGSTITNTGFVDYTTDDGVSSTATSNVVSATVTQVYSVLVTPDGTTTSPGQTVYTGSNTTAANQVALTYTLKNTGNGADSFTIATAATTVPGGTGISYYLDTNGNGVYDAGTDTLVSGAVSLAADASKLFFAVYTVPANTAGGTQYDITPSGTSVGDATKTDANNLGRIIQKQVYDFSFTSSQSKTVTTPGTATFSNVVTNTGNTAIPIGTFSATSTLTDTNSSGTALAAGSFTDAFTVTLNGTTYASAATLAGAFSNASAGGSLAVGSVLTVTTSVSAPAGRTVGDKDSALLSVLLSGLTNSASLNNNRSTALTNTDLTTVVKGLGAVSKTQALCGLTGATAFNTCPASSGAASTAISVRPGDYVVYYVAGSNSGNSAVFNTRLRDALPAGVSVQSLAAVSSQAGTVLYSIDGATWTSDPTTLSVANGATVYAALDTNASGTITVTDTLSPAATLLFRIKVKVNDGTPNNTVPLTDAQTVS